jgi:FkbM family methyltransferase
MTDVDHRIDRESAQPPASERSGDALPAAEFQAVRMLLQSGQAYWTVVDPSSTVLEDADGYLRFIRFELEADEIVNKQYARNLAYYVTWTAKSGLDLNSGAPDLQSFSAFLRSHTPTSSETALPHSPERVGQILATARGFHIHLVERESAPHQALTHLHEDVLDIRELGVTSYAQSGEDLQIAYYVGREQITYIDVGCLWPKQHSNSYFFYERGGRGLCIDANPTILEEYRSKRPRDTFLNCGIAATEGSMTYHMHKNPVFNTFSTEHADQLAQRVAAMADSPQREGRQQIGVREVPVMTLDQAVASSGFAARCENRLDFLSIDVEGLELQVLCGFSFHPLRPRLVVVEDVPRGGEVKLAPEQLPVVQALKAHRYRLAGRSGLNLYFLDEDR